MQKLIKFFFPASLAVGLLLGPYQTHTHAQTQCNAVYTWSPPTISTNTSGLASAPGIDTTFNPTGNSDSYFAQGNEVYAVRNVAEAGGVAGSVKWKWQTPSGATILSTPTPVLLSLTTVPQEAVFVTATDGFLYKINAADGTTGNSSVDTRRTSIGSLVCPQDQLTAAVAVQLYRSSNTAFQANVNAFAGHAGDDVIFVVTNNGCGDTTNNRVISYWASDLTAKFIFNAGAASKVDASNGSILDYDSNTLFFGTLLQSSVTGQNSLFALDSLTGQVRWSTNAGSILTRPTLSNGRLYVAGKPGIVQAFALAGDNLGHGLALWTAPVAFPGAIISSDVWPVGNTLLVATANSVSRIQDLGSTGTLLWQTVPNSGVLFTSRPVAVGSLGKVYIGRSDGIVQELDLATGQAGNVVVVNAGATVFDPSLDIEGGASDFNRLVVVADATPGLAGGNGKVTRLIVPFCDGSAPLTVNLSSSGNSSVFGQNVTFTATLTVSGTATPSGAVTFLDGTTPMGSAVTLVNGGPAQFAITLAMHAN